MTMKKKKLTPKKLLVASVGVATLSLVIGCDRRPAGNLAMPDRPNRNLDGGTSDPSTNSDPSSTAKDAG